MRTSDVSMWLRATVPVLALVLSPAAFAAEGFPASVSLPGDVTVKDPGTRVTNWDSAEFQIGEQQVMRQGKLSTAWLAFQPEGHRPAAETWKAWAPLLAKAGWKVVGQRGDELHTLSRKDGPVESLLAVELGDYADPKLTLLELKGQPTRLTLAPPSPAPKIEKVSDTQDWPYLVPFPGAKLTATIVEDSMPFLVKLPGDEYASVVADGRIRKGYRPPPTLSAYEFEVSMRDALARAGWDVLPASDSQHLNGQVEAHYTKNGRNIWAFLVRGADDSGEGLTVMVADIGAQDWAKALRQDCRLTLLGVNFDFNKATLRPESTSVLQKAATTLQSLPQLKIEVQGHTDNVGDDAYNARLSDQRAEAVRTWLVGHGVAADRLSSKGYGKSKPIATNDSDEGRARNRRVELTCVRAAGGK
ncbi:MAG: OmpA family protein [Hyalangium sp.]|uniref:OmpA family protein n=1 Tax=Hyalangium sp. TaxID=2028555 RepID=UPI00389A7051